MSLFEKIVAGYKMNYEQAVDFVSHTSTEDLCVLADMLRKKYNGKKFDTCSIMNARSGRCPEDCKWCAQSKFHNTSVKIYPLVECDAAMKEAEYNAAKGVRRFSLVTSGRALSQRDMEKICVIYRNISDRVNIKLCASLGLLDKAELAELRECGVVRYHCNMETAPSYFPRLCSTHTSEEKMQTIRWAKEVGLEVCSGGIIGMGETELQRIEFAVTLRDLGVDSIPINILNPIPGTKLEGMSPLSDDEVFRAVALVRILNPRAHVRLAGGRTRIKHLERKLLSCGISSFITGDMLTTTGSDIDSDLAMVREEGLETE